MSSLVLKKNKTMILKLYDIVQLSNILPKNSATQQHLHRAYYGVQNWFRYNLQPLQNGWTICNSVLETTTTTLISHHNFFKPARWLL